MRPILEKEILWVIPPLRPRPRRRSRRPREIRERIVSEGSCTIHRSHDAEALRCGEIDAKSMKSQNDHDPRAVPSEGRGQ
jgi:hypothetical protein